MIASAPSGTTTARLALPQITRVVVITSILLERGAPGLCRAELLALFRTGFHGCRRATLGLTFGVMFDGLNVLSAGALCDLFEDCRPLI